MNDDVGNSYEFSLVSCKCVGAYVRNKKNQNQVINKLLHKKKGFFVYLFSHPFAGMGFIYYNFSQISDLLALAEESQFG